jgi:hypothetical protein
VNYVRLLPVILSLVLLGAHYYRAGFISLVIIFLASIFLLFIRTPWAVRIIKVELLIGGFEWLRTLFNLASVRIAMEMPWMRLVLILGGVALMTFASILVFRTRELKKRYGT